MREWDDARMGRKWEYERMGRCGETRQNSKGFLSD
jgi:hypothetical protein